MEVSGLIKRLILAGTLFLGTEQVFSQNTRPDQATLNQQREKARKSLKVKDPEKPISSWDKIKEKAKDAAITLDPSGQMKPTKEYTDKVTEIGKKTAKTLNPNYFNQQWNPEQYKLREKMSMFFFNQEELGKLNLKLEERVFPGSKRHDEFLQGMSEEGIGIQETYFSIVKQEQTRNRIRLGVLIFSNQKQMQEYRERNKDLEDFRSSSKINLQVLSQPENKPGKIDTLVIDSYFAKVCTYLNNQELKRRGKPIMPLPEIKTIREAIGDSKFEDRKIEKLRTDSYIAMRIFAGALKTYFIQNGKDPEKIEELIPLFNNLEDFVAPGSSTRIPQTKDDISRGRCDYIYFSPDDRKSFTERNPPIIITNPKRAKIKEIYFLRKDLRTIDSYTEIPSEVKRTIENN